MSGATKISVTLNLHIDNLAVQILLYFELKLEVSVCVD